MSEKEYNEMSYYKKAFWSFLLGAEQKENEKAYKEAKRKKATKFRRKR
jgi:hypothetical protein